LTDSSPLSNDLSAPRDPFQHGVDPIRFSRMLGVAAVALLVVFLAAMLRNVVPVRLLDATWQLRFTGAVIDNAFYPLISLVLLYLACFLDGDDPRLRARYAAVAGWAVPVAFGFLLLIPLQAAATWSGYSSALQSQVQQQQNVRRQFGVVRFAINAARSSPELRSRLERLQDQPISAEDSTDFSQPLPQLRETLLKRLDEMENAAVEELKASAPPISRAEILLANITAGASSLAYALAFAAAGHRRHRELSLYDEWHLGWVQRRERSLQRRMERHEKQEDLREIQREHQRNRHYEQARQEQVRRARQAPDETEAAEEELIP
jgi:hypothetical protein